MDKDSKNNEAFEKKRPVDKMKIAQKVFAFLVILIMVFSVGGTLLFYLLNS